VRITVYGAKYHTEHAGALGGPLDVDNLAIKCCRLDEKGNSHLRACSP